MARPSGNATDDRRRPRSSGLNLRDIRYVRPQMRATSMPADTTPAPAPAQPTRPPGMVASSSSVSAAPLTYVRSTEDSLLCDPSRLNQPCLHPDKLNGALWFGDDLEVHAFVRATWQGDYWGPWQSWVVPEQKRTGGWHSFIQQYYWEDRFHDEIHFRWRHQTQVTICGCISQKRTTNKQPKYISEDDWKIVLANWSTEEAKAKSQSASESRCSPPPGMKMHAHGAGPHCFANVEHRMVWMHHLLIRILRGGLTLAKMGPSLMNGLRHWF